ncbi:TAXI family TRAP transporter solute-binding subunit [Cytobacillus purgationiresistens]|uniref:TRAP transporter TAXI family solute receptor n=1 Tax=Cytobacillus purgationiresistens TaxID=863449 RepID=A0ABU0AKJ5_9BACI|nr:TAXI family TRAP transporter solute-binding subunit [Cytobacillus purgationiresistens]MDQ0271786.1 TRAP transporter TAXI family solute receptor [Cytobacillus purgationiresistens]
MKAGTVFSIWFLFILLLAGCENDNVKLGSSNEANTAPSLAMSIEKPTLMVATGDMSGVYFPLGQALAGILEKYNGIATGTRVTNASIQNAHLVSAKQAELGICTVDVLSLPEIKKDNLRALTGLYSNYIQIVTTDSSIQSIEDLSGKRVSLGTEGSGTKLTAERIVQAANLTKDEMDISYLSFTQSAAGLRNGTIDAAFFSSGLPNPVIEDMMKDMNVTLVAIPEKIVGQMQTEYGVYQSEEISAETYDTLEERIPTLSVKNVLLTHADIPDSEAYNMLQTIYQHLGEWQEVHPAARFISQGEAMEGVPIEFHSGAKKYFKEVGGK